MYTKKIILSVGYEGEFGNNGKIIIERIAECVYETLYGEYHKFFNSIIELPTIDIRHPN